jgi:hypothetical protein
MVYDSFGLNEINVFRNRYKSTRHFEEFCTQNFLCIKQWNLKKNTIQYTVHVFGDNSRHTSVLAAIILPSFFISATSFYFEIPKHSSTFVTGS